jgi:hypothetical protein
MVPCVAHQMGCTRVLKWANVWSTSRRTPCVSMLVLLSHIRGATRAVWKLACIQDTLLSCCGSCRQEGHPHHGCLGTCILSGLPECTTRLHFHLHGQAHQLGCCGRALLKCQQLSEAMLGCRVPYLHLQSVSDKLSGCQRLPPAVVNTC